MNVGSAKLLPGRPKKKRQQMREKRLPIVSTSHKFDVAEISLQLFFSQIAFDWLFNLTRAAAAARLAFDSISQSSRRIGPRRKPENPSTHSFVWRNSMGYTDTTRPSIGLLISFRIDKRNSIFHCFFRVRASHVEWEFTWTFLSDAH